MSLPGPDESREAILILPTLPKGVTLEDRDSQPPGTYHERFKDPAWSKFVAYWLRLAKARHTVESLKTLQDDDRLELEKLYKGLCTKAIEYKQKVDKTVWPFTTDYSAVYDTAIQIEGLVTDYLAYYRKSVHNADQTKKAAIDRQARQAEIEQLSKGLYSEFSKQYNVDGSFDSGLNIVTPADIARHREPFQAITAWLEDAYQKAPGKRVFWLQGAANSGKSVVINHFVELCNRRKAFAGGYRFCSRDDQSFLLRHFLSTLTVDIAALLGEDFQLLLEKHCRGAVKDLSKFLQFSLKRQFRDFILPAYQALGPHHRKPLLVTLDNLDQCEEAGSIHLLMDFLDTTLDPGANFPVFYLISSRPTPWICWWMDKHDGEVLTVTLRSPEPSGPPVPPATSEGSPEGSGTDSHEGPINFSCPETEVKELASPQGPLLPRAFTPSLPIYMPFRTLIPMFGNSNGYPPAPPRHRPGSTPPESFFPDRDMKAATSQSLPPGIHASDPLSEPCEPQSGSSTIPNPKQTKLGSASTSKSRRAKRLPLPSKQVQAAAPSTHLEPVQWKPLASSHSPDRDTCSLMDGLIQMVRDGGLRDQDFMVK